MRSAPWRYAANVALWTTMWVMPVIPALITRAFFDRLQSEPGFNAATLIAMLVAYGFARLVIMVLGMWNDVHFMFRTGSLLRRNMLERVYELPGAQAVHESPGETISRFREDVGARRGDAVVDRRPDRHGGVLDRRRMDHDVDRRRG